MHRVAALKGWMAILGDLCWDFALSLTRRPIIIIQMIIGECP